MFHPENGQFAELIPMTVGGAVKNGINISLKNVHKAYIVCKVQQAVDATQITFTLAQSSGNAGSATGTGEKALTNNVNIWINQNCALDNGMTKTTAAKAFQTDAEQSRTKLVVFEVKPAECMDVAGGFDCITVNSTDPAAANTINAFAVLIPSRYSAVPSPFAD